MVKIFRTLLVLFFFTLSSELFAQVNEVTLVTSGEGATENDAVNEALRSAIEQAYGVFVSANTDILNDELVKDEIVTVSSGNIHSYKKLGCVELANGNKSVSVEATVSVSNLVSFAQSKGASCEFAGAVFGANLKLINLNKANAEKAIEHLYTSLESVAATMYDYEVEVGQPKSDGTVEITAIARANENYKMFTDMVYNTLKSLSVNNVEQLEALGVKYYSESVVKMRVNSLASHSPSEDDFQANITDKKCFERIFTLFDLEAFAEKVNEIQQSGCFNFVVTDSNESIYTFDKSTLDIQCSTWVSQYTKKRFMTPSSSEVDSWFDGKVVEWCITLYKQRYGKSRILFIPELNSGDIGFRYKKTFHVSVEKLMTISGFTIERKVK